MYVVAPAQLPAGPEPTATQTPTDQQFSSAFRTWVRETTRRVLLAKDLQSYRSQASRRLRVADTPFTRVQAELDRQDEAFRAAHLPPNIAQGDALERLLCDTVKSEKAALAILIKIGLTRAGPPNPVPRLCKLIAHVYAAFHPDFQWQADHQIHSDKQVTPGAKIQICYIRFMANLNRINQNHRTLNRQKLFWDDIDEDLARLRRKSSAYGVAYSQLIFNLDQATWTGEKTVNDVEEAAQQVPPHKEVQSRAATLVEEPNEEVALEE
ncbi:hypothetical protein PTTG_26950 [Puccinia triticina 1-1 BBBD Race 1]|uniref:Uncharacterized protein n=1 Tax=Puccinia triticina (isolate 1-1 / race 1 (BBBD)) TaxID=630390 RepID=A0A180GP03_PUCT1|nr:hypothetical protein PTTG_26950 [Puccinia triticina 1-1 BBBD Race 1]